MAIGKYKEWLTEDGLILLRKWARNGLTDAEIAENIGITATTLYNWKNNHVEIFEALKKTKDIYDSEVEEALEKAALGYYVWEEEWRRDPDTGDMVMFKKEKKWIKPDTTAQIFWLKNRDRQHWRDKQDITLDAENDEIGVIALPQIMTPEKPPEQKIEREE
jgi:transcriptional regulator with XRE-family HTH domain